MESNYINRDISWLSFNERVLSEAGKDDVPLSERLKFLSIYSSNLDEFYRVRMPALLALDTIKGKESMVFVREQVRDTINRQQQLFGKILLHEIKPLLERNGVFFIYQDPLPEQLVAAVEDYFYTAVAAFLQPVFCGGDQVFFPENNKIYLVVDLEGNDGNTLAIIPIPSVDLPRFRSFHHDGKCFVVFLDDVIRQQLPAMFKEYTVRGSYAVKVTRDAELDLEDDYKEDIAEKISQQIIQRDFGMATRFLYDAAMPRQVRDILVEMLKLQYASQVEGGRYHNLKDLSAFPAADRLPADIPWPASRFKLDGRMLMDWMDQKDILLHLPYQRYDTILRFFNEAAIDSTVTDIWVTLYRIAGDSRIAHALISAARNGKNVTVFVELKARFDEANNIQWAQRMQAAGVKIIYSIPGLKVHAKVALVSKKSEQGNRYHGLLATGNFNETTARFYTDHVLLSTHPGMLSELEQLFVFLARRKKPDESDRLVTDHLLIAPFSLQQRFVSLIDYEITEATAGRQASITLKLNNLEEKVMIDKLYEASGAGVKIDLIVRGICRLKPGLKGLSENIKVTRIVDRYLEHGRVFMFHHGGEALVFLGSADWMSRNLYRRIEVCFPVYDALLKAQLKEIIALQLKDNVTAVTLDAKGNNVEGSSGQPYIRAQECIYRLINSEL